jgi:hypothetical protein
MNRKTSKRHDTLDISKGIALLIEVDGIYDRLNIILAIMTDQQAVSGSLLKIEIEYLGGSKIYRTRGDLIDGTRIYAR